MSFSRVDYLHGEGDAALMTTVEAALGATWAPPPNTLITFLNTDDSSLYYFDRGTSAFVVLFEIGSSYTDENARDAIGAALVGGTGITITPDDTNDVINIEVDVSDINEIARDAVGAALTSSGASLNITPDDTNDVINIEVATAAEAERIRDVVGAILTAGSGIAITPDDTNDIITIESTGGYTDEQAQDAVGTIFTDNGLAVVTYSDATPSIDVNVPAAAGSDYRTGTDATKALTSDAAWDAAAYVALTDAATVAVDMSTGINFSVTLGGNRTLGAPSNMKEGQTGVIVITQDGTGSRTLAYNAAWLFAGGTDPTLSTAAGAKDMLFYTVLPSAATVFGSLVKAIA